MDLEHIQNYYNDIASSWREVALKFDINASKLFRLVKLGKLKTRSKEDSLRLNFSKNPPRTLSTETKNKISKSRKEFLKNNPDMVPYKLNHKHKKISYPEQYFIECFQGKFSYQYMFDSFSLDFVDIENKLDIEIDGCQHRLDRKIIKHDLKRNIYLTERGWNVLRINWAMFQTLNVPEKQYIVNSLINNIIPVSSVISFYKANTEITDEQFYKNIQRINDRNVCPLCGGHKYSISTNCQKCAGKNRIKIQWPSIEEMTKMVWEIPTTKIAKEMNISDNAITKFCRKHSIKKPGPGYWQKLQRENAL